MNDRPRRHWRNVTWPAVFAFLILLILAGIRIYCTDPQAPLPHLRDKTLSPAKPVDAKALPANPGTDSDAHPPKVAYGPPPPEGSLRPGEFEEMDGILLAMAPIDPVFDQMWLELIRLFSTAGFVWILADGDMADRMTRWLEGGQVPDENYVFLDHPFDSIWIRDYGPEFVIAPDGSRHLIDNNFHKAAPFWPRDDAVPIEIGKNGRISEDGFPIPIHSHPAYIAGGNLMTDGAGTCFTSMTTYTHDLPRDWTKEQADLLLRDYYGCRQTIVLEPLCLESTGHIDLFAKIVSPTAILLGRFDPQTLFDGNTHSKEQGHCQSRYPDDHRTMEKNLAILESTTNLEGRAWDVIRVPMPEPYYEDGSWIYRSYLNAQLFNGLVVMPAYREARPEESRAMLARMEQEAVAAYQKALPHWKIHALPVDHIISSRGAIHCITHEIPAAAHRNQR